MPDRGLPTGREMDTWIAEHVCNWKRWKFTRTDGSTFVQFAEPEFEENAPYYSTDLATAHEAEGRVPEELREDYVESLSRILGIASGEVGWPLFGWKFRRATPAQICEAIYRAMEGERG